MTTPEEPIQKQEDIQEKEEEAQTKEEEMLQGKNVFGGVSAGLDKILNDTKGKGSQLPEAFRAEMEDGFGADFSEVRIHTGADAIMMTKNLRAQAFAHGRDIYFNVGKFDPNTKKGKQLMAHELTHTVQQGAIKKTLPEDSLAPNSQNSGMGTEASNTSDSDQVELESPDQQTIEKSAELDNTSEIIEGLEDNLTEEFDTDTEADTGEAELTPRSPEEDPNFQALEGRSESMADAQSTHQPAEGLSSNAQSAAPSPSNERESIAQAGQVDEMDAQEPTEFDAEGFKKMLLERIKEVLPKDEEEADNFKDDNKMDQVKDSATTQVESEKQAAAGGIEEATQQEPNTAAVPEREVTNLETPNPGPQPPSLNADTAMPPPRTETEVNQPLQEGKQEMEDKMAEENITDEQLANSNEPAFTSALDSKNQAKEHADTSPQNFRQEEQTELNQAQEQSENQAQNQLQNIHGDRTGIMGLVAGAQNATSSNDTSERQRIAGEINIIYEKAKTDVDTLLNGLDEEVNKRFDTGNERATKSFEDYVEREMDKYKEERYGAWFDPRGWGTRIADAVVGLPDEVNVIFVDGRQRYINIMDKELTGIAKLVANTLNKAKERISRGRQEVQEYVNELPANLKSIGQKAAEDIQSKFDELQDNVNSKQEELIDTLAERYSESLQAVDARIEEMQAANRGLVDMALDAIGGVIKTIINLKNMLLDLLSSAKDVITTLINDPIGFLGNLISGIGQGLKNFGSRIWQHLQAGLIGWLTGALGPMGIQIPDDLFSLKGIFSLIAQILGLTWDFVRRKAVKLLGEKAVQALEAGFEIFKILASDGISGVWEYIKEKFNDLKTTVIDAIKDMVITTVINAGIKWIMGLLNPASAFVKAVMMIIDIVRFFIERGSQIMELIKAFIEGVKAVASGNVSKVAEAIENALKMALPIVIGFLANLLGIGGLARKVTKLIKKIRARINKAINGIIKKARKWVKKLFKKGKAAAKKAAGKLVQWWKAKKKFKGKDGKKHKLFFKGSEKNAKLMVASNETTFESFIRSITVEQEYKQKKDKAISIANTIDSIKNRETAAASKDQVKKNKEKKKKDLQDQLNLLSPITAELLGIKGDLPVSEITYSTISIGGGTMGQKMTASLLTKEGEKGSTPSGDHPAFTTLLKRRDGGRSYYIRGHLLNDNIHGPGKWKNMTILSQAGNKNHLRSAEEPVKKAVLSGAVVSYSVEAIYGRADLSVTDQQLQLAGIDQSKWDAIKEIRVTEKFVPEGLTLNADILTQDKNGNFTNKKALLSNRSVINPIDTNLSNYEIGKGKKKVRVSIMKSSAEEIVNNVEDIRKSEIVKIKEIAANIPNLSYYKQIKDEISKSNLSARKKETYSDIIDIFQKENNVVLN